MLHKIVYVALAGTAVLGLTACAASTPAPVVTVTAPATTQAAPLPEQTVAQPVVAPTPRYNVAAMLEYKEPVNTLSADMGNVSDAATGGDYSGVLVACATLGQHGASYSHLPSVSADWDREWKNLLSDVNNAAVHCVKGVNDMDADEISTATTYISGVQEHVTNLTAMITEAAGS